MLLMKLKAQFQPSSASEVRAVVEQYRNTPVIAVDVAKAPLRPNRGTSTSAPPTSAPGIPRAAMMVELRKVMYVEPSPNFAPRVAWMSIRFPSQRFFIEMRF